MRSDFVKRRRALFGLHASYGIFARCFDYVRVIQRDDRQFSAHVTMKVSDYGKRL